MNETSAQYFEDLPVDLRVVGTSITLTEAHLVIYAGLTGDFYKLHMDAHAAAATPFGQRVAHGPFTLAPTIGQLARRFTNLDWQVEAILGMTDLRFLGPLFIGDTLTPLARVAQRRERETNGLVTIEMTGRNQDERDIFTGFFTLMIAKRNSGASTEAPAEAAAAG